MANLKLLRYKTTSEFNNKKSTFDEGDIVFNSEAGILYIVTDKNHNVEPYYGSNAIKNVSLSNATLTISFLDGTSKDLTVNNVATAGEATKATTDSENNPINTTYFKKSGGTINGATTINGGLTATGETDVESLTADSLIVNGSTRFNNDVIATTFTGNLKGNADTATSAITAGTASKLSSNAGSATLPVYFTNGVPKAINTTGVGISITGSAASATKDASGNVITKTYATKTELGSKQDKLFSVGTAHRPIYFDGSTPKAVTNVESGYVGWCATQHEGLSALEGVLSGTAANVMAYAKTSAVTVEYTEDGGTTWTDYGATDEQKIKLFLGNSNSNLAIKRPDKSLVQNQNGLRITIDNTCGVYCYSSMVILRHYFPNAVNIEIQGATYANPDTFTVLSSKSGAIGNPSYQVFPLGRFLFGNNDIKKLRFQFMFVGTAYLTYNHSIANIQIFAQNVYSTSSTLASTGHLYSYDVNKNATFPGAVTANTFSGNLTGNASTSSACTGNSATATRASSVGEDNSMKLYAQYSNEINFGGVNTSDVLFFGYRATDSRPVPTSFIFGGSNGTATLTANGFKKKDSSDSYVLTGGGGHSKISDLSVGYAVTSGTCSGNAATATKLNNALTIGDVEYDGSSAQTITAATLGLSSALLFLGTTTTALSDGSTTQSVTIGDSSVTAQPGNVVLYDHLEFIWNGSSWEELGDEKSFALKSVQINAGSGLTGGGTLKATMTISHDDTSSQASITTGGRTYINSIILDDYGHVTALGTGTETNQTDISGNAATATKATTASYLTFVDKRADYPGNIVTSGARIGGSFMSNSTLGISNNGSYSDAIIIRGYGDSTGGPDNALIFNKATTNVWHTQFTFGSTDSWGTPILFLDTNNYNSYAPKLDGTGATGTWGISISGNAATASSCSGSAATLATSRTLWGQSFNGSSNVDGTIRITPTTGNWTEGIRIKPYSGWTTILLGGTEVGDTGTSTNSWSLHAFGGNFYVNRNASNSTTSYILCNVSGNWGMGTNSPSYKLDVQGTLRATGATTFSSSLSVTGDIAASSNVNVTNQTKSKTFSINGGCTLEYDSTNKCVKFVF